MKTLRDWATPLVFGVFLVMAITGLAMFFHFSSHLQSEVHEWAGWGMVAFAVAHIVSNFAGFKKHFRWPSIAVGVVAISTVLIIGAFTLGGDEEARKGKSPPMLAMAAITKAPITQVAPLFQKTPEQALEALKTAGFDLPDANASLESVTHGEREKVGKALAALTGDKR